MTNTNNNTQPAATNSEYFSFSKNENRGVVMNTLEDYDDDCRYSSKNSSMIMSQDTVALKVALKQ